jgi:hypothetical protein
LLYQKEWHFAVVPLEIVSKYDKMSALLCLNSLHNIM